MGKMDNPLNKVLMDAVASCDPKRVSQCLKDGADPNYHEAADDQRENPDWQPSTPLRMVVFRLSDCLLKSDDLDSLRVIAKMLLKSGADPKPAMQLAELRYGPCDPHSDKLPFQYVLDLIARK